ncbi:transposase domain-containing protein [Serratia quinivorans]|uniref:transposase domain-containing protein n=1 Tax=Serratia quinivorans TaxID=137545 RepID=UPI0039B12747
MGTCRLNGVDPEVGLRHVIRHIPGGPTNKVDELLPGKLDLTPCSRQYGSDELLTRIYGEKGERPLGCSRSVPT